MRFANCKKIPNVSATGQALNSFFPSCLRSTFKRGMEIMLKIAAWQDQIAKGRSLGIKCARVSLLDINIDGFTSAKLFLHQRCMTAFRYEIPRKFILPVKIFFFCGFRGGKEKFAEIRAGSLSRLAASL